MRIYITLGVLFIINIAYAQVVGGKRALEFLNLPANAHLSALGKYNVSVASKDPYLSEANPALLNKKMDKMFSVSFVPYVADIKLYSAAGAYDFKHIGLLNLSVKYLNYGKINERAEDGTFLNELNAQDYSVSVGKSETIGVITLGINARFIGSDLGSHSSYAWATDFGALFKHPEQDFTFGLAVKNLGRVYKQYTETAEDSLPFDVQMGTSFRPKHAPIRISLTGHHLNRWDIVYNDPGQNTKVDEKGQAVNRKVKNFERLIRHMVLALELMPVKYLDLRVGYNYLMSRELSLTDGLSAAGISMGGAIRWEFLEAAFTHMIIQKAGGMNTFTLNLNLGEIGD